MATNQQVLTDDGVTSIPHGHYQRNRPQYDYISARLGRTKEAFVSAPNKAEILRHASEYAIISVQTLVENHEQAFLKSRGVTNQDELAEILLENNVTYHNNKARYIVENRENVDFADLADRLADGETDAVHAQIADDVLGLASAKSAFTIAMLGFTEKMCIDSHTANIAGMDRWASSDTSIDEYAELSKKVRDTFPKLRDSLSPFLQQWVQFDADKGHVEMHDPWFAFLSGEMNIHLI